MVSSISEPPQLSQLELLPHPVYFVCKNKEKWQDVMGCDSLPPVEPLYQRCVDTADIWSPQTYIDLKRRGLNVYLVPDYIPGKICVTTYDQLLIRDVPFNSYVVACRHDRARPEICEQRIVINELCVVDETDHFVPHWPQPNLKSRERSRGSKVENLVFKGFERNLARPFKEPTFTKQLSDLGINLVLSSDDPERQFDDWADYTQADAVLAVRNITEYDLTLKPALKLINAWFAGCPAILGPEPAYQAIRRSELDYIEARNPEEVIVALKRLKENPSLHNAMIENGFERSKEFTTDRVAQIWRDILAGPIAEGYEKWLQQSPLHKLIGRPVQYIQRAIKHKNERKSYFYQIHHGPRLFD